MIILSATNISKGYGTDTILKDVSFHINKGERVGIVGANGAGKSTLMRILCGRLPSDTGAVFVSAETSIGYLAQGDVFRSEKTVIEEVEGIFSDLAAMEKELLQLS